MPSAAIGATASQPCATGYTPVKTGVQLKADIGNSGTIFVGYANTVTAGTNGATDGMQLSAGNSYFVPAIKIQDAGGGPPDAQNIWIIGSTTGPKVYFDLV
jgi:hypothetical protein